MWIGLETLWFLTFLNFIFKIFLSITKKKVWLIKSEWTICTLKIACRVRRWRSVKTKRGFLDACPPWAGECVVSTSSITSFLLHAEKNGGLIKLAGTFFGNVEILQFSTFCNFTGLVKEDEKHENIKFQTRFQLINF